MDRPMENSHAISIDARVRRSDDRYMSFASNVRVFSKKYARVTSAIDERGDNLTWVRTTGESTPANGK